MKNSDRLKLSIVAAVVLARIPKSLGLMKTTNLPRNPLAFGGTKNLPPNSSLYLGDGSSKNYTLKNNGKTAVMDPCGIYPLNNSTWVQYGLDDYIKNITSGKNITVQQYAKEKHSQNFKCGIESYCNIGQLCSPVTAPDWYILYATQRLNIYFNTIYQATQDAIIFTQSITSTLYNELIPPKIINDAMDIAKASAGVGLGFEAIAFAIILVISSPGLLFLGAPFALMPVLSLEFTAAMVAAGIFITMSNIAFLDEITTLPGKKDLHFKIWSEVNFGIVEWQENIQKMISNMTTTVFNTPISSDSPYSLKEILKNGTFLEPFEPKNSYELEVDLRSYTMSMAASSLLRSINAFVVIDKIDNCANLDKKWNSKSRLSYCSPDGTWMKIIRTEPKSTKAINDMGNANVLHEKYNWTTEYISNTSFNCQLKYGAGKRKIDIVMEKNLNILKDPKECAFDLPVCDLRQGNSRKLKHKHHRTVEVCRDYLGLPI